MRKNQKCIEVIIELLEQIIEEPRKDNIHQVTKNLEYDYTSCRHIRYGGNGNQLSRHSDLWKYTLVLCRELVNQVGDS